MEWQVIYEKNVGNTCFLLNLFSRLGNFSSPQ